MTVNRQRLTTKVFNEILLDSGSEEEQDLLLLDHELNSNSDKDFADIGGKEVERRQSQ